MQTRLIRLFILLIVFITVLSFSPCLKNGFTEWDDQAYVIHNEMIRSLSLENIKNIFSISGVRGDIPFVKSLYHPLPFLTYAVEYHFFQFNPSVYHCTNIILHVLNTLLVFWMIFILTDNVIVAFITAIFFGVHPLRVESVAWIAERKDVLYSFFFLASLICYIYYMKKRAYNYYYLSLFMFLLSLFSKPMAVTLPFVLFLFDYFMERKFTVSNITARILYFLLSGIFIIIQGFIILLNRDPEARHYTFFYNICIASHGIIFYTGKLLIPVKLACIYPHPSGYILPPFFIASLFITPLLFLLIIFSRRYTKKVIFGSLFFLITLLPVSQLIPVPPGIAADRYTYIPSIGFSYIIAEGFYWLYNKYNKVLLLIILSLLICTLSFLTWNRCNVWSDNITLWSDTLRKYPDNFIPYYNRGCAYYGEEEYDRAIADFSKAIEMNPLYEKSYYNRANAYGRSGEYDKAISDYTQALKLNPDYKEAYYYRGISYARAGDHEKSRADIEKAKLLGYKVDEYKNKN
ncbi:MAG: tetratricopeptide repeat protein [Candidatus Eremiobacterota bacterium]